MTQIKHQNKKPCSDSYAHTLDFGRRFNSKASVVVMLVAIVTIIVALQSNGFAQSRYASAWPDTDFSKTSIDLDEIRSGGPPKDGIPAIDNPDFLAASDSLDWIELNEPVIALEINDKARAYPIQILMFHEIVNDELGGVPVSVTFCPLCNSSIVFDRRVGDRVLDFGTTGKLRMSDMVMYDRQTESWWQQFIGEGIVGEMTGVTLKQINSLIVSLEEFLKMYPEGEVLSRNTGFSRPYGSNPYAGYDNINANPFLFDQKVDSRLRAMERVINVSLSGIHKLYTFTDLEALGAINDEIENTPVVILAKDGTLSPLDKRDIGASRKIPSAGAYLRTIDGEVFNFKRLDGALTDTATGSQWNLFGEAIAGPMSGKRLQATNSGVHFAFAWLAFNPESEIYKP